MAIKLIFYDFVVFHSLKSVPHAILFLWKRFITFDISSGHYRSVSLTKTSEDLLNGNISEIHEYINNSHKRAAAIKI